jgi:transposase
VCHEAGRRLAAAALAALVAGERDPEVLAELAKGVLRKKIPALRQALRGRFRDHHALLIGLCLDHTAYLETAIARLDERIDALIAAHISEAGVPFGRTRDRLDTIPGVGKRAAECILAEIGADMTRFASARHLASWAGQCPGNDQSAGKRRSGKTRNGSKWLDFAAQAPTRAQEGPRSGQALTDRRDLAHAQHWRDLPRPRPRLLHRDSARQTRRLIAQLERLGHHVTLQEAAAA